MSDSRTNLIFARKLVRPITGQVDDAAFKVVENEVRAIQKLCNGSHQNIIHVLRHGRLRPNQALYFIDMEYCDANLDYYVQGKWVHSDMLNWSEASQEQRVEYGVSGIIIPILSGLIFIHSHDEVHRDLNPRNGNYPSPF
jgi:serine/threonine protein kinase